MKLKPFFLTLLLIFTLSGCYNKFLNFVYYDKEIEVVRINGIYPEVEIFDLRQQVSERDLKKPGPFSMPGWNDMVYPKLNEEHKSEITNAIKRQFINEGDSLKVTCVLNNSVQKVSQRFFRQRIFVTVELTIFIYDDKNKLIDSHRTTEYLEYKSSTMLKDYMDLLYKKALRNAVHKCFISFEKIDDIKSKKQYYRNSRVVKFNN